MMNITLVAIVMMAISTVILYVFFRTNFENLDLKELEYTSVNHQPIGDEVLIKIN